jgi:hypothetical protein
MRDRYILLSDTHETMVGDYETLSNLISGLRHEASIFDREKQQIVCPLTQWSLLLPVLRKWELDNYPRSSMTQEEYESIKTRLKAKKRRLGAELEDIQKRRVPHSPIEYSLAVQLYCLAKDAVNAHIRGRNGQS